MADLTKEWNSDRVPPRKEPAKPAEKQAVDEAQVERARQLLMQQTMEDAYRLLGMNRGHL